MTSEALSWLTVASLDDDERDFLSAFDAALRAETADGPPSGPTLLEAKRRLATHGWSGIDVPRDLGGRGHDARRQALMQFIAGYHDPDLRDVAHIGHGWLLVRHGTREQQAAWIPRLLHGELIGIAASERTGGSNIRGITSRVTGAGGRWRLDAEKRWISRLNEAAAFVVFARDTIRAAVLAGDAPNITRTAITPVGLTGWSWGTLATHGAPVELLPGDGLAIFRSHFTHYRPMVALVALGAATHVLDVVADSLRQRLASRRISTIRDSARETIAAHRASIEAALLLALAAVDAAKRADPTAARRARAAKAHGAQVAHNAIETVTVFLGAEGYVADTPISKAQRDVRAFLYADGMHDALLRSVGREIIG